MPTIDVLIRIARAVQDETMSLTRAKRLVRTALSALQQGDRIRTDLVVMPSRMTSRKERESGGRSGTIADPPVFAPSRDDLAA